MKIQWSGLGITEGRGKLGGNVAARNASGAYLRKLTSPIQPNSPAQAAVKSIFAGIAQAWRTLTEAQRTAWNDASPDFPQTNSLGQQYFLTGSQLYSKLNNSLQQLGLAGISDPPVVGAVQSFTSLALVADSSGGAMDLTFTLNEAVDAGISIGIFVTPPISAGINNFNNRLELLAVQAGAAGPGISILASYNAKYGGFSAGQKIGIMIAPVNETTGQRGGEITASTIAV